MQLDYFYGSASEHFRFYQIPALLLEEDCYRKLRDTSKLLYGVLLSQLALSRKNGWIEQDTGRIYIHYNLRYLAQCLGHSANTITRSIQELCEAGLLRRRRRGRGLTDILYVMDFTTIRDTKGTAPKETGTENSWTEEGTGSAGQTGKIGSNALADTQKEGKKETGAIEGKRPSSEKCATLEVVEEDEVSVTEIYKELLKKQINYQYLLEAHPMDAELIEELLFILISAFTTHHKHLRVNGEYRPVNEVQNRLKRIDAGHIEYILQCMKESTKKIVNPPLFLLTALYNAPATINTYYNALAAHDMSHGFFASHAAQEEAVGETSRQPEEKETLPERQEGIGRPGKRQIPQEKEPREQEEADRHPVPDLDALGTFLTQRRSMGKPDKGG